MFKRVLVANRGEIAVRIINALREMGIESVAIYSDADRYAVHTSSADYAYALNGNTSLEAYSNIEKIIRIAKAAGVDAIHPGYGFLSERAKFAEAVEAEGIKFIGPKSEIIRLMGDKFEARRFMLSLGVPVVRGSNSIITNFEEAKEIADIIGYPVLIKAAAGGGGMGMKIAYSEEELKKGLEAVQKKALADYGDSSVFVEKYIERPRHIEVQVIGDNYGNYVHLGERECSIQRRHQKVIEEAPSSILTDELRKKMGDLAVGIAKAVGYNSVGTIEFIYDNGEFYFLEMNTRIQVEHTITEMITGIDIVKTQIEIAAGLPLRFKQEDIKLNGHAIECRICAEDPFSSFMPSPGKIIEFRPPGGFGIRNESGVTAGYEISTYYDSMLAKLIAWGNDRAEAIARMRRALQQYVIEGPKTTIPLLWAIMDNEDFKSKNISTKFLEEHKELFEEAKKFADQTTTLVNLSKIKE
ncbi:MAG TPA: acetyl-CoA carboxylase biotin carboxylase subunit [Clostridia bacterium]|nr:acetyl-CoA carboxylase biotin carboxylase subunit [Clostridia bacterium]